jgi:gliding motility-associated-like protein
MNKRRFFVLFVCCITGLGPLWGQLRPSSDTTVSICSGLLFDSGGDAGSYGPGQRYAVVLCPAPGGGAMRIALGGLDIGPGDSLCIFDGNAPGAALLGCITEGRQRDSLYFQATVNNPSGCLRIVFSSDAEAQGSGWGAVFSCGLPCQTMGINIDTIAGLSLALDGRTLTGCLGQPLFARVSGRYPSNGRAYAQSDFSTRFSWFLDGDSVRSGRELSYLPVEGGLPVFTLKAEDIRGCRFQFAFPAVLVPPKPVFSFPRAPEPACTGDTVRLSAAVGRIDTGRLVNVLPGELLISDDAVLRVDIASLRWRFQPGVIFQLQDSVAAVADTAGLMTFLMTAEDIYGCKTESRVAVPVFPSGSPECGACRTAAPLGQEAVLCAGDSLALQAGLDISPDTVFSFKANPQYMLGFSNHPHSNQYAADLPVRGVPLSVLDNPAAQIGKVCLDITTDWAEDLNVFLRAPDGRLLELTTGNGGGFDDYRNTCFSPSATTPITAGEAPFSGIFMPEGPWEALRGAPVNGDWALLVSDGFDPLRFGRVESWTIAFAAKDSVRYTWSPAVGLSCTDCPSPLVRPAQTTVYEVKIETAGGCLIRDSIRIVVRDSLEAPAVRCNLEDEGIARFTWAPVSEADGYEVVLSINGRDSAFVLPVFQTAFSRSDLRPGDVLLIRVRARPRAGSVFCGAKEGTSSCIFRGCTITARLVSRSEITCFGQRNGRVEVQAQNGTGRYGFQINGDGPFQSDAVFDSLAPGPYFVVARDEDFCTDTVFFDLAEPLQLVAGIRLLGPVSCAGRMDGAAEAFVRGGTGPYRFSWSNGRQTAALDSLGAGVYRLTVSDARACAVTDSIRLQAPPALQLQLSGSGPSCSGNADGSLNALAIGGTGGLKYLWNTGAASPVVTGLGAGQYCVTVSDLRNCEVRECFILTAPAPLALDSVTFTAVDCPGGSNGSATAWVSGGTAPYTYTWSDPLAQAGRQATMLIAGTLGLRVRDARGCTIAQQVVVPGPLPIQVELSTLPAGCRGESSGGITARISGGTAPYEYNWSNGENKINLTGLAAGEYRLTVTDAKGCKASGQGTVGEPSAALALEVVQETRGCTGEKMNTAGTRVSGGNAGGYTYLWSNGATGAQVGGLDSLDYAVTVTDSKGCKVSGTLKMADLPPIVPNMIVRLPSCFNGSDGAIGINFVGGRPGADLSAFRFVWSTGATGINIGGLRGEQEYAVTVTDPQGCRSVVTRYVRQPRPVVVSLSATAATCFGSRDGSVSVAAIDADTRIFRYAWNIPGSGDTRTITGVAAGIYRITVTDEFNCTGEGQIAVGQPPALSLQFALTGNRCFGDSTGVAQLFGNGGSPPYRFTWPDGSSGSVKTGLAAGSYEVVLTDSKGCRISSPAVLQPPAPLDIRLNIQDVTCNGGRDGALQVVVTGGRPPVQYAVDGKNFRPSPTIIGLGAGQYTVTVQDANGCTAATTARLNEPLPFTVDAGPSNIRIKLGDTLVLKAVAFGAQGRVKYTWIPDFPGTLSCTQCETAVVLTQNTISYVLSATDSVGCEARDRITVNVSKDRDILVPTGFSPNGDGNNDRLLVHGLSGTRILSFRVFDRWGELVYEQSDFVVNDPAIGWDGTFRGQPLNPGVFVWFMEAEYIDGYKETRRGQTTLLR